MKAIHVFMTIILTSASANAGEAEDPFLWLEEIEGEKALDWARERNAESLGVLEKLPEFEPFFEKNLAVYDSQDRIAYPAIRGEHLYNFWRDAEHERGLWRRTSFEEYRTGEPQWEVLIDLDALAEAEGENWVWDNVGCLAPDYERCLVRLSRGGADAVVVREFDIPTKTFVEDGFQLPEAKGGAEFLDHDTVYVMTDFGAGSMTESGYPRIVKTWKRGTPLEEAATLFEGEHKDIGAFATTIRTPERDYSIILRYPSFFTHNYYLVRDGELHLIPIPDDAEIETIFRNQVLISLKSDWQRGDETWPQGALVSVDLDELIAGEGTVSTVIAPDPRSAISEVDRTRDLVLVNRMTDVRSRLSGYSLVDGEWKE
ncbi:MAG: S9 family peptidase, partial [Desulfuromonadales bacterium]|nr:S9 family peptidase [Desulfuromonadales bacterium]